MVSYESNILTNVPLDESLYSRQIYVLGHEAMNRMRETSVLISGLGGVGVELAKCVILGGVKNVTLHDDEVVQLSDLSTQYYLSELDLGKKRTCCASKLMELNPYVKVDVTSSSLESILGKYDVIVITNNLLLDDLVNLDKIARMSGTKFILCQAYGAFGNIFCDFGDNFTVFDVDGEEAKSGIVVDMYYTNDNVVIQTVEYHGLAEGDTVIVTGFDNELIVSRVEDTKKFVVKIKHNEKDKLVQTLNSTFQQIKKSKTIKFNSLEESLDNSNFVMTDIMDCTRPNTLHAVMRAINKFNEEYKCQPSLWSDTDAEKIYNFACKFYPETNKNITYKISHTLQGQLIPVHAIIGSIGAQEVMKACSGKFYPIHQWFYYDVLNSLPDVKPASLGFCKDRYYGQRVIFGDDYQEKLLNSKVFVVGSGAIGCEHLKNLSMMGIGNIVVTDMDRIEKSNLNRQFLFRVHDIGKLKSEIAAREIRKMNSQINIIFHENKVCTETESVYDEKFFNSLTCVLNALDNVGARLYVDDRCVTYHKSLLESGTLGTKGNVQTIIPDLTESYGSMKDPVEQSIPVCTLKNFPFHIEHCIQFALHIFEGYFVQAPNNTIKYLTNRDALKSMTPSEVVSIVEDIQQVVKHIPLKYEDCIKYAYQQWHNLFRDQILQLRYNFPPDCKTSEGIPFWSVAKKCPSVLTFDPEDKLCTLFVESFANLWADVFGLGHGGTDMVKRVVKKLKPHVFIPKDDTKISVTEEEEKTRLKESLENSDVDKLIESLPELSTVPIDKIKSLSFEKDDDSNFHIDFITSTSNSRATNYNITLADRHKTKGIAGKIIPAIATTTSLVSALVSLELYKIVSGVKDIEQYRNSFVNLAIPFFGFTEPAVARKFKIGDKTFTFWDSTQFTDVKLVEIIEYYKQKYDVDIDDVTVGQARFYSEFLSSKKKKERLNKTITSIYFEIMESKPSSPIVLTLLADGNYDLPACKVYF